MQQIFHIGENVRVIDQNKIGTVNQVVETKTGYSYKVMVDGKAQRYQEKYLEKYIDEEGTIVQKFNEADFGGVDDFVLFQTWYRLKRPIEGNLYSYLGSKTLFNPYQFKPLLKFISSQSEERLFIADEVGVGKTIETGIILTELVGRGRIDSHSPVWIVCPNALGPKWVKEMKNRFNFKFHLHDGASLKNAFQSVLNSGEIDPDYKWSIVSLQLLRRQNFFNLLKDIESRPRNPLFSMVIIDEAHHLRNKSTENNALGNTLSGLTEMLIMLSATPLNLRDEDLFNQMHILNPAMFPDFQTFEAMLPPTKGINRIRRLFLEESYNLSEEILTELRDLENGSLGLGIRQHPLIKSLKNTLIQGIKLTSDQIVDYDRLLTSLSPLYNSFTRSLKRDAIEHRVTREPINVGVELSSRELDFYNQVIQAISDAFLARGGDARQLGFISNIFHRMVSSCIPAMQEYFRWVLENNQIYSDVSNIEDVEDDSELENCPLDPSLREKFLYLYKQVLALKDEDSKYRQFKNLIDQLLANLDNPQVIVFSFFIRTLNYLKIRLEEDGYRVGLISGEIPLTSEGDTIGRYEIMETFEKKEINILLSSEVGGEGLDFQFCQAIVNYDLPYNPMRIEQRIGRIDRFGQKAEKIMVASMYIKNTIDEKIYSVLYERIRLVEDSVGILEPILGNELLTLQNEIINGELTPDQMERRLKELEISLANSKKELERFETNRKELLGEEDFMNTINNLHQTNFVKPSDAIKLTEMVLTAEEGCSYQPIDQYRGNLILSKEMQASLEQFRRKPGYEKSILEIKELLQQRENSIYPVIFDGQEAIKFPEMIFLPPCGYWTKFLLCRMENRGEVKKVFGFQVKQSDIQLDPGFYIVPFFEVKIEGFRIELYFGAVPIEFESMKTSEVNYIEFTRQLNQDTLSDATEDVFEKLEGLGDISEYINAAEEVFEYQMEEKMRTMKEDHNYRLETRVSSLRRGSQVRVARLQSQMENHKDRYQTEGKEPSSEFIRMLEAQIVNEQKRTAEKVQQLNQKKDLILTISLVAIGAVHIV